MIEKHTIGELSLRVEVSRSMQVPSLDSQAGRKDAAGPESGALARLPGPPVTRVGENFM